jgi:hypothetical protein
MVVVPLVQSVNDPELTPATGESCACQDWLLYSAAGTLAAGSVLLVTGNRKAGLAVAAAGAAMAMLDQRDTVVACWNALPEYLNEIQAILARIQSTVDEVATQGAKLREVLGK